MSTNLTQATRTVTRGSPEAARSVAPTLDPGTIIGRYQVLTLLGCGGMGMVYKAYDPQLDRGVALKLMRASASDDSAEMGSAAARLLREAQALAQLNHPNVVAVHDVGTVGDQVFVAMELVEGTTLGKWLSQMPRPTEPEILRVLSAVANGLAAAHDAGLVHRDIKPDNIIIGSDQRARILDFGLARACAETDAELEPTDHDLPPDDAPLSMSSVDSSERRRLLETPVTRFGAVIGTPVYMAPEQRQAGHVDARADQFSFCLVLYEALYGVRAVRHDQTRRHAQQDIEGNARPTPDWPPPPPHAGVPAWLHAIVERGLALDPDARFPSMHELAAALRVDVDATRRSRRKRWMSLAALAVVAVLPFAIWRGLLADDVRVCADGSAELIGVWDEARRATARQAFQASGSPIADEAWQRVSTRLDTYADDLRQMHRQACTATRIAGSHSEDMLDLRMLCLERKRRDLRALVDLLLTADGSVIGRAAQAAYELSPVSECGDLAGLVASRERHVAPPQAIQRDRVAKVREQISHGRALSAVGRHQAAQEVARASLDAAREIGYPPLEAEAYFWLAMVERTMDEHESSAANFDLAYTTALAVGDFELAANAVNRQTFVVGYGLGRIDDGLRLSRLADALIRRQAGDRELAEALRESNLGILLSSKGENAQALIHQQRALEVRERVLGPNHPEVAVCLNNLAILAHERRDFAVALAHAQRSVQIFETAYGPRHPKVLWGLTNLADVLSAQGSRERALDAYQRALAGFEETIGPGYPGLLHVLRGLADLRVSLGDDLAALAFFERIESVCAAASCHPASLADARFHFAKALFRTEGDRTRVLALASAARRGYVSLPEKAAQLAELDAWLREHDLGLDASNSHPPSPAESSHAPAKVARVPVAAAR